MSATVIIAGDATFASRDRVFDCPYCKAKFIGHSADTGFELATLAEQAELGITAKMTCPTCTNTAVSTAGPAGEVPELVALAIGTRPAKTLYKPGDKFVATGLVILGQWSNGVVEAIPLTDCTLSPDTDTALTLTDDAITVTHTASSKTIDVSIRVENAQVRKPILLQSAYPYTGEAIAVEVKGFDSSTMTRSNYSKPNVGNYTATYNVKTGYCWEDGTTDAVSLAWSIVKAVPTVTAPTPKTGVVYNGSPQAIINSGSTTGGTMKYSKDGGSTWATETMAAVNAGTYTVLYKVDGGSNYEDVPAASIETAIAKATPDAPTLSVSTLSLTAIATPGTITVTRDGDGAVSAVSSDTAVCTVAVESTTVTVTAVADGEATVTVTVGEGTNYEAPETEPECAVTVALT